MSTSSSLEYARSFSLPIAVLQYRDISDHLSRENASQLEVRTDYEDEPTKRLREAALCEAELASRIERERADAAREAEQRIRREYEQKLLTARASIANAISGFEEQRADYYARVEAEVVQLALAIAAKILHREAQVDPMLLAALVRLAVEKMREDSNVTVRVSTGHGESWKDYISGIQTMGRVEVIEDAHLGDDDCLVETELGAANFGLDAQLKEIEQGFFDLLALRPVSR